MCGAEFAEPNFFGTLLYRRNRRLRTNQNRVREDVVCGAEFAGEGEEAEEGFIQQTAESTSKFSHQIGGKGRKISPPQCQTNSEGGRVETFDGAFLSERLFGFHPGRACLRICI